MDVYKLFLACLLGFAILNYAAIPEAKRRWDSNKSLRKIGKAGLVGALNFARTFLLIASLTYLILLLIIFLQGLGVAANTTQLKAAADRVQGYRHGLASVQKYFVAWIGLMLIIILSYLAYRREKRYVEDQSARKIKQEEERLQSEAEKGEWESLPATEEMREILASLQATQEAFDAVESNPEIHSSVKEERKETLRGQIKVLRHLWYVADIERRMNITLDFDGKSGEEVRGQSKFGRFIGSKGFIASMKTSSRSLTHVGTVLLVLSLVGLNTSGMDQALQAQQVHWNDLRVEANQQAVKDSFNKLLAQNPPKDEKDDEGTSEEKNAILNYLARSFEQSLARSDVWRNTQWAESTDRQARRAAVKEQILSEVKNSTSEAYNRRWNSDNDVPPTDGPDVGPPDKGPKGGGGPSGGKGGGDKGGGPGGGNRKPNGPNPPSSPEGATPVQETAAVPEPRTAAGIQFRKDLDAALSKRPGLWTRVKGKFHARLGQFSQPAAMSDVSEMAFSEMWGAFVDTGLESSGTEVDKLIAKIAKTTVKGSGKEAYSIVSKRLINDLTGETSIGEAFRHVETLEGADFPILKSAEVANFKNAAATLVRNKEYIEYMKEHPPTLADNPNDVVELNRGAERFKANYNPAKRTTVDEFNAFASYDDIYPGQKSSAAQTVQSKLLAGLSSESSLIEKPSAVAQADFVRSRSYADLVGHSRTGGVLIGRAPDETTKAARFVDLQWSIDDKGLQLLLKRVDGQEFRLGPYKPSLVHQALGYVADGRTAAVTILNVDGDGHQKIFLHPAFVDTQLGRDIIELDQFVFKVMKEDPHYDDAVQRIDGQRMLYRLAWMDRALAVDQHVLKSIEATLAKAQQAERGVGGLSLYGLEQKPRYDVKKIRDAKSDAEKKIGFLQELLSDKQVNQLASKVLQRPDELRSADHSILAYKSEFFDPELVEDMSRCAGANKNSLKGFNLCIQSATGEAIQVTSDKSFARWFLPIPTVRALSGVRETPFKLTSDLSFLIQDSTNGQVSQLWPLDFMILRAFSSRPEFLTGGQDPDKYSDRNPWQFGDLKGEIANKVWNNIDSDARLKSLYQDLRDFTVLQRLFRVALESETWNDFPAEKLVGLTEATAASYKYVPTPRWYNPRHGSLRPEIFEH